MKVPWELHPKHRAMIALLLLVPVPSLGVASAMLWWPDLPWGKAIFLATKIWIVLLPFLWLRAVDHQSMSWSPPRRGGFGAGAATGLLIAIAILGAFAIARAWDAIDTAGVAERAARTGLNQPAIYLAGAMYWILVNSLMEEYVWRWFVFRQCESLVGGRAGVILAALGFTAHHVIALAAQFNWGITLLASLGVFVGGATWSGLYLRYRSIWPGYVSHAIVDVPIFVIGYRLILNGN
jgi:hypothetical protein